MSINIKTLKKNLILLWEKGAFHIFIGNFLTKFIMFFGSIFLVRALPKESYGLLGFIENIYGYVYLFAGMGLSNAILRFIVLAKKPEEEYGYYKYILKKGTIFNIFLILFVGVYCLLTPLSDGLISARWLLLIIVLTLPFQFLVDNTLLTNRAKLDNKRFAITTLITATSLIYIKYFAAVLWDINGVIIAHLIVNVFFGVILCIVTYKIYFKGNLAKALTKEERKVVDHYSIQYMITNGVWAIFMLNDILLLGIFSGDPEIIAEYKVAYVLPGNLAIISSAIGVFVAPYFVKHELDNHWVKKNYIKVMSVTAALIGATTIILIIIAEPLIILLFGTQYQNIVPIMRLLLIAAFINSGLRFTSANILAAMGKIKYNMLISITGIVLQTIFNILLIPKYGAMGVAWTSIIVYLIMAVTLFVLFAKEYKLFQR